MQVIAGLFELVSERHSRTRTTSANQTNAAVTPTQMAERKRKQNKTYNSVAYRRNMAVFHQVKSKALQTQIGRLGLDWLISKSDHSNAII